MSAPAVRPRPMGGFNQGFGQFNEHLDEDAMQTAVQQKGLGQQSTLSGQPSTGGSALGTPQYQPSPFGQQPSDAVGAPPAPPREIGTIKQELVDRPLHDIVHGLASIFDINSLLEINPKQDDPQTQARKKQVLHNYQKLEQEDQAFVQQKYKQEMQKKQQEEQEEQLKKQKKQQEAANSLVMPSSPKRGDPSGQKKPAAVTKLEEDRKTLGGPQNVG